MLIRSQDKLGIINLNCVKTLYVNEDNDIVAYANGSNSHIGSYSTEEKAIKVLDMIQSVHEERNEWLQVSGKVFQMPQDSEV